MGDKTFWQKFQELYEKASGMAEITSREVRPTERVLGNLTPHLIKMWGVYALLCEELESIRTQHSLVCKGDEGPECLQFWGQNAVIEAQMMAVKEMFFASVRSELTDVNFGKRDGAIDIGIRAGNVVVQIQEHDALDLQLLASMILGSDD